MKSFRENLGLTVFLFLIIFVVFFCTILYFSYGSIKERTLTSFAQEKEKTAGTLEGYIVYQGDTVKFSLMPAISFPIEPTTRDYIEVISNGKVCTFVREMLNDWDIPAPDGEKFMRGWQSDNEKKIEKKFLRTFKNVVKNGKTKYS